MALSGLANGTAPVTATYAATGMNAAVQVIAKTLQNKFYLFQLTPAAETTLQYTDGKGDASVKADNVSDAKKQVKSRIVSLYQDFEYLLENENLWNP